MIISTKAVFDPVTRKWLDETTLTLISDEPQFINITKDNMPTIIAAVGHRTNDLVKINDFDAERIEEVIEDELQRRAEEEVMVANYGEHHEDLLNHARSRQAVKRGSPESQWGRFLCLREGSSAFKQHFTNTQGGWRSHRAGHPKFFIIDDDEYVALSVAGAKVFDLEQIARTEKL